LRADVLAAVNRLLDEWGSHEKLTMRAVAKEVGVAAPSIYLHFADKTELVWAALADKYEQLAHQMRVADESVAAGDARGRLLAQVHAYCRFAVENPGHYRLMYEVRQPELELERAGRHPARAVSGRLRAAVSRCFEAGFSLSLPPRQAAHTLWSGLHGLVSLQLSFFVPAAPQMLDGMAAGLVDALVAREPVAEPGCPAETDVERLLATTIVDDA
jgi:AcrR family transcriptional regulator